MRVSRERRGDEAGFTVIEVVYSAAALAIVWAIATTTLSSALDVTWKGNKRLSVQRQELALSRRLRDELRVANVTDVAADGLSITYQHALDLSGSGSLVDPSGVIMWGANEQNGPIVGNSYTIRFVQSATILESGPGVDLNSDGDFADTFRLGHLERVTSQGRVRRLSGPVVLIDASDPQADLDNDGQPDPLFAWQEGDPVTLRTLTLHGRLRRGGSKRFSQHRIFLSNVNHTP